MPSHLRLLFLCLSASLLAPARLPATPPSPAPTAQEIREAEFKAAAIYNIIAFTDWPPSTFPSADSPLVIGVLGHGPVATLLPGLIKGEKSHGRPIVLRHYNTAGEVGDCHLLFIARSVQTRWNTLREELPRKNFLTVSDLDNFAVNGGSVQVSLLNNKLRLTVNLHAARAAGVTLSSRLLRLADVIGETRSMQCPLSFPLPGILLATR